MSALIIVALRQELQQCCMPILGKNCAGIALYRLAYGLKFS